ncbi:MAG: GNAT family N-acetyltransferase [Pseudomonadales bacterium]
MAGLQVRPASNGDREWLLALNNAASPAVNALTAKRFAHIKAQSLWIGVAERGGGPLGFLLALNQDADYDSVNFRYFHARYPRFAYVDRVVVAPRAQSAGVGSALYAALFDAIAAYPVVACEVNIKPANVGSLRFHERLGFSTIGEQDTEGGTKRVSLLVRPFSAEFRSLR